jgi:hypothetical protein
MSSYESNQNHEEEKINTKLVEKLVEETEKTIKANGTNRKLARRSGICIAVEDIPVENSENQKNTSR